MIKMILVALGLTAITVVMHGFGATAAARRATRLWEQRKDQPWSSRRRTPHGARRGFAPAAAPRRSRRMGTFLRAGRRPARSWRPPPTSRSRATRQSATAISCCRDPWRMLGPIESAVGVLMLGWSTGILVAVIGTIYRRVLMPPRGKLARHESGGSQHATRRGRKTGASAGSGRARFGGHLRAVDGDDVCRVAQRRDGHITWGLANAHGSALRAHRHRAHPLPHAACACAAEPMLPRRRR